MAIVLSIFYFFYFATIGSFIIYVPNMLKILDYSVIQIGILFSIVPFVRFITPFLFKKFLSLNFNIVQISIFINLIACILYYYALNSFLLLFITIFIYSVSFIQFLPFCEAIAIKYFDKERYGKIRLFGSIGFIFVALIIPYFSNIFLAPIHIVLISSIIMYISLFALHFILKKDITNKTIPTNEDFSLIKIWPFWIAIFLMQLSFGGLYNFFTIYILEHNISLEIISYLWTFGVICEILILYFQKHIFKRFSLLNIMQFSLLTAVIRWLIIFIFPSSTIALFISQSLHAFCFALFHSASIFYLFNKYQNKQLAQYFYLSISFGLGSFLGASFAGFAYGKYLFLYESIFVLIAFLLLSGFMRDRFTKYF
jgi:PPP family 3-phenylpropionic acid transporter